MNKQLLESAKIRIKQMQEQREEYLRIVKRIQELEQNEFVQEYLNLLQVSKLKEFEKRIIGNEEQFMENVYHYLIPFLITRGEEQTNNLYLYQGTYTSMLDPFHKDYEKERVSRNHENAKCSLYHDLERTMPKIIPIAEREDFEKTNTILFSRQPYEVIQEEFYQFALEQNEEEAVQKMIKKYAMK